MPRLVALDAGPLAALFIPDDSHHQRALQFVASLQGELFTTVATVTEALYLLDFSTHNQLCCLEWLRRGGVRIENLNATDWDRLSALLAKYADLPADFADVALIAVCERLETRLVATIDSDFSIYRFKNRMSFENVFL
jgi:predicted nucleic acid-binding protein